MSIIIFQRRKENKIIHRENQSLMAAYLIAYRNEGNELLTSETVFMRNLVAAKSSATSAAPDMTYTITISDIGDEPLATKKNGKWCNH